jgi:tetratricopeptide (TPR) repeat protein
LIAAAVPLLLAAAVCTAQTASDTKRTSAARKPSAAQASKADDSRQTPNSSPTNVAAWRQLAQRHEMDQDFTNSAPCWKRVAELTGNEADYGRWLRALGKTDMLDARFEAVRDCITRWPTGSMAIAQSVYPLVATLQANGQTNRIVAISDAMLAGAGWMHENVNIARVLEGMNMPQRAIRHVSAAMADLDARNRTSEAGPVYTYMGSLLARHGSAAEIANYIGKVARSLGAVTIPQATLARLADALGPDRWTTMVAEGEAAGADPTQRVAAAHLLSGSNLNGRAATLLQTVHEANPTAATFSMLRDIYSRSGDQAAVCALYSDHMRRNPETRKNRSFVSTMLGTLAAAPHPAAAALARQSVQDLPDDTTVAAYAAAVFRKTGNHSEAVAAYTTALTVNDSPNVLAGLAASYEEMGEPVKAAIVAFHTRSKPDKWLDRTEFNRMLDRLSKKPAVGAAALATAETAIQGRVPECQGAGKLDWQAFAAWAAEGAGDLPKALVFQRAVLEKDPSPATARNLAALLLRAGRVDEAVAVETRAVQDTPPVERHAVRMELINMLISERRFATVVELVDQTLTSETDPRARNELSDTKAKAEVGARQEEFVQKVVAKADSDPSDAAAQRSAAQSFRLTDRPLKAAEYYGRALAEDDQVSTRWDLAYVLTSAKRHKDAAQVYQTLLDRDLTPSERDIAIKAATESLESAGDAAGALQFLRSKIDDIRAPYVKTWATSRIQALTATPPQ